MATKDEVREALRLILAEDNPGISKEELEQREKALFERTRLLLTKTQLEMAELEARKMEVEQHMRQLKAIVSANSLLVGYKGPDE